MSEPGADSAQAGQEQGNDPADSAAGGQEHQGDQSKRVNDLMSLANQRLGERNRALAEIEQLRAQLAAQTVAEQSSMDGKGQIEAMFPERFAQPDAATDGDPMDQPEPPTIIMGVSPARPDHAARLVAATPASTPAARYARDQAEIATMKAQLNGLGQAWFDGAKAQGLLD